MIDFSKIAAPVSASNTLRGRKSLPEAVAPEDYSPEVVAREVRRRMILQLRDDAHEIDFKELCAGLQRLQPFLNSDASATSAVTDEALAEMEHEAGLV